MTNAQAAFNIAMQMNNDERQYCKNMLSKRLDRPEAHQMIAILLQADQASIYKDRDPGSSTN